MSACFGRPHTIFGRVRIVEAKPHNRKGTPALAGYLGTNTPLDHREDTDCRVGNFHKARPAFGEVPETLWPTGLWTSGEMEVCGMWVLSSGEI